VAISIDWENKIINIPRNDLTLVQTTPFEIRELDLNNFHLELRILEESAEGMVYSITHDHIAPINIGAISLVRIVFIINNYTITFEDGAYAVNIVNGNSNVGDVINVNQVSVRSSNSTGLAYSSEIIKQSFQDARVWIDINLGSSGTLFSKGTPTNLVNNAIDAQTISDGLGDLRRFHLRGALTLPNGEDFSFTDWKASASIDTEIDINGVDISNSHFENISLTGMSKGYFSMEKGLLRDITNFIGQISFCSIEGNIIIDSTNVQPLFFVHCHSTVLGTSIPILDINDADCGVNIKDYFGGLEIKNFTQGNNLSIDISSGNIIINSTCTNGTIVVRGVAQITDNSGPGCTVVTDGLITLKPLTKNQFLVLK